MIVINFRNTSVYVSIRPIIFVVKALYVIGESTDDAPAVYCFTYTTKCPEAWKKSAILNRDKKTISRKTLVGAQDMPEKRKEGSPNVHTVLMVWCWVLSLHPHEFYQLVGFLFSFIEFVG